MPLSKMDCLSPPCHTSFQQDDDDDSSAPVTCLATKDGNNSEYSASMSSLPSLASINAASVASGLCMSHCSSRGEVTVSSQGSNNSKNSRGKNRKPYKNESMSTSSRNPVRAYCRSRVEACKIGASSTILECLEPTLFHSPKDVKTKRAQRWNSCSSHSPDTKSDDSPFSPRMTSRRDALWTSGTLGAAAPIASPVGKQTQGIAEAASAPPKLRSNSMEDWREEMPIFHDAAPLLPRRMKWRTPSKNTKGIETSPTTPINSPVSKIDPLVDLDVLVMQKYTSTSSRCDSGRDAYGYEDPDVAPVTPTRKGSRQPRRSSSAGRMQETYKQWF